MTPSIEIFADTADPARVRALAAAPRLTGFTTNPTLFRAAGAIDYLEHARALLDASAGKSISLEVIADERKEMARQARILAALGPQVVVKVPVMTTRGEMLHDLIAQLRSEGIPLNVTAIFTARQVLTIAAALAAYPYLRPRVIMSIFAGRIADAGRDACGVVRDCVDAVGRHMMGTRVLWASPRQVYDVVLAEQAGCDIITMTPELIAKMRTFDKDLLEFSRETVGMFYTDAQKSGFTF